jgi:hypothetical protein
MAPLVLDHVILAAPALSDLTAAFEARTGVPAAPGGRHAGQGTHNALVGLGPGRYLELLAPDPEAAGGPFRDAIAYLSAPGLHTWCVRGDADGGHTALGAEAFAARVVAAGATPRRTAMARTRPDGVRLAWELVFVDGHGFGGLVPFFIDWLGSPHPSAALGSPLAWRDLRLEASGRGRVDGAPERARRGARRRPHRAGARAAAHRALARSARRRRLERARRPRLSDEARPPAAGAGDRRTATLSDGSAVWRGVRRPRRV